MAEELKGLIEKINEEGIKAAEEKARVIEDRAARAAEDILTKAKGEARTLIAEAKEKIAKMEESSRASLNQAGRDLILALRKEINTMLDKLITSHVHRALDTEELAKIITALVKECAPSKTEGGIVVTLKKEDLEKLEKGFLTELKAELKKDIVLRASDEMHGGFLISYDSGKSYYDFTDKALAQYMAFQIKPRLAEILNESAA